jgi:septum formation protein
MKLILASSSPYRQTLLKRLMLPYDCVSPNIDETPLANERPSELVARLATEKAHAIAKRYPNTVIVGADQVAVHGDNIVGKPGDHTTAVEQLRHASGSCVQLTTGLCVISAQGRAETITENYRVYFRALAECEIEHYLRSEQPYDCAGSVKIEGLGIALVERLEGDDPTAIIGLPLIRLCALLKNAGVDVLAAHS